MHRTIGLTTASSSHPPICTGLITFSELLRPPQVATYAIRARQEPPESLGRQSFRWLPASAGIRASANSAHLHSLGRSTSAAVKGVTVVIRHRPDANCSQLRGVVSTESRFRC